MTTMDGRHFGNRLREARVQAGFSQSELEELSGIPKARLSRYENGHVEPSIQTLARLARALNVSEASLLGDQRAILEGFFNVLSSRGVHITSVEQGARLANAVADMVLALGGMQSFGDGHPPDGRRPGNRSAFVVGRCRGSDHRRHLLSRRSNRNRASTAYERGDRRCQGRRPRGLTETLEDPSWSSIASHGLPTDHSALQGNISRSTSGSLRAMHFHRRQWDYWFVIAGQMFVALVDLRAGSPTERAISTMRLSAGGATGIVHPTRCGSRVPRGDGSDLGIPGRPVFRRNGRVGDRLERPGPRDRMAGRRPRPVRPGPEQPEPRRRRCATRFRTPATWVDLAASQGVAFRPSLPGIVQARVDCACFRAYTTRLPCRPRRPPRSAVRQLASPGGIPFA